MTRTPSISRLARAAAALAVLLSTACTAESVTAYIPASMVRVHALTPATIRSLVVEVTGPGIEPAVVVNLPVGVDSIARGTLSLPAGNARRFVITAVDTSGVATHRGDTTVTLHPGADNAISVTMHPLPAAVTLTVSFDAVDGPFLRARSSWTSRVFISFPE